MARSITVIRTILIAVAAALLTSCFAPEDYKVRLQIEPDGSYLFSFEGRITNALIRQAFLEDEDMDAASRQDLQATMDEIQQSFLEDPRYRRVQNQGLGTFEIEFEHASRGREPFSFFDFLSVEFDRGVIAVEAGAMGGGDAAGIYEALGMVHDGEVVIEFSAPVIITNGVRERERYFWDSDRIESQGVSFAARVTD